ncbi:MAG TPA: ATP-dependent DNA helicase [Candidatus Corynebacterium avicola]|uniref:ATP-dependent helicase DinG n=1 Tax=Candidatus Corynebacterium avicola TaxID=2838527 RepID=A0A9D1RPF9_9CORY|nr:ATP-dependent DNA helicase [Candidatus Corynebacterium avicola]
MAQAVSTAIDTQKHLAVQAGTGTGKSLAYLVPSLQHAVTSGNRVVVSTATLALQRQLIDRDLPRVSEAVASSLGREPSFAILKGRNNYLCLNRIGGTDALGSEGGEDGEDASDTLLDSSELTATGAQVARLHDWAQETEDGDRDSLPKGVSDRAWRQVSVTSRECVGASRCPFGDQCFAEAAKERAAESDVVVTNHALLAINALAEQPVLPEHDTVVIDEAHELESRITSVATEELSGAAVAILARRCEKVGPDDCATELLTAGDDWTAAIESAVTAGTAPEGRWTRVPAALGEPLHALRDALWKTRTRLAGSTSMTGGSQSDPEKSAEIYSCVSACEELHDAVVRILDASPAEGDAGASDTSDTTDSETAAAESLLGEDVVWLAGDRSRRSVYVAPLSVADLLRQRLFTSATVVLTSATLALGGRFSAMLASWGVASSSCRTLDVGTPFDARTHGILYTARHLPPPGREGTSPQTVDELAQLVNAAGGRTLGLFSSRRAAENAAAELRTLVPYEILCQGEDSLGALIDRFRTEPETCLFGTLSLWQGVDVPGPSLSLVVIDRIPFPRPDDPLSQARKEAADAAGRSGFMEVAATHAGLLMAQGAGRLLRSVDDRGVVAVLDQRLVTKRYGSFLRASMPQFWPTVDGDTARGALRRLRAS